MTLRFLPDAIETWPLERLKPYARNARTHSEDQVARIAGSLIEYGWTNPVMVADDGEIVAGHGRLLAAQYLGLSEVPVIRLSHLTPAQVRAYRIADNRFAELAGWDDDLLAAELHALNADGFDLDLTGFDGAELDRLLAPLDDDGEPDEDAAPEPPASPVSRPGDLWLLGEHRLLCGDSTQKMNVARLMDGRSADMIFTDPPYGMDLDVDYDKMFSADTNHKRKGARFNSVIGDNVEYNPGHIFDMFPKVKEVILWGADYYRKHLPDGGSWYCWDKRTNEQMDKVVGNTFELAWSLRSHKREVARILWSGHHGMALDDVKRRVHPTQKPIRLVAWFFERIAGDAVVDLFLGSGSTLIAAENAGRRCLAMELDPAYVDVAVKRWEVAAGKEALLDGAGPRTFAEVAAERAA